MTTGSKAVIGMGMTSVPQKIAMTTTPYAALDTWPRTPAIIVLVVCGVCACMCVRACVCVRARVLCAFFVRMLVCLMHVFNACVTVCVCVLWECACVLARVCLCVHVWWSGVLIC